MNFSIRFLTTATIFVVSSFWLLLVVTMSMFFYQKMVDHVVQEKVVWLQSIHNILVSPEWKYRENLNVGSGATRIFISETAKAPGVVFFRLMEDDTQKVIFSSSSEEEGTLIKSGPLGSTNFITRDSTFHNESIMEISGIADRGQSLWMGISLTAIRQEAVGLIIRELWIAGLLIIALIFLLFALNKKSLSDIRKYQHDTEQALSLINATLESTVDGILVVNSEGKISKFNNRFIEMWKIPREILEAKDDSKALDFVMQQVLSPDEFINKVKALYNAPEESSFDSITFKDGRIFERYSKPQRVGAKVVGRVWDFRDITASKLQEQKLEHSTNELQIRTKELEATNKMMVGRELRMMELKKKIKELEDEKLRNAS